MKQSVIYKLHQKYSVGNFQKEKLEIGWTHSLIIKNISLQIADKLERNYGVKTDKKLIEIGALIHDIGIYEYLDGGYKTKKNYVLHGRTGYEILIKEGVSKKRARFALTHIGVGYENDIPISIEEEIVAYADSFHSKKPVRFNSYDEEKKILESFGQDKCIIYERFKDKFGIPDLKELKEKYEKWHEEINEWVDSVK
ncbi:MAG: HD domain-containing protein [Candidatus Shapirobacteria bacterium]|jgi:uncharacterized protein